MLFKFSLYRSLSGCFIITEGGVLKFPVIIVELYVSPYNYFIICFVYFETLMFGACMFLIIILFVDFTLYHYILPCLL